MRAVTLRRAVGLMGCAVLALSAYAAPVAHAQDGKKTSQQARPNLDLTQMRVHVRDGGDSMVKVELTNSGGRAAQDARVRLEDNGHFVRVSSGFNLPAHSSQVLLISWPTTNKHGSHRLVTIADPQNIVRESNETDNRAARTVVLT